MHCMEDDMTLKQLWHWWVAFAERMEHDKLAAIEHRLGRVEEDLGALLTDRIETD